MNPIPFEYIFKSKYDDLPVPRENAIKSLFENIDKWRNHTAIVCGYSMKEITYSKLQELVYKWCGYFKANFSLGTTIAFISHNCPETVIGCLGAMAAGMVYCGIYTGSTTG